MIEELLKKFDADLQSFEDIFNGEKRAYYKGGEQQSVTKGKLPNLIVKKLQNFFLIHTKIKVQNFNDREQILAEVEKLKNQRVLLEQKNDAIRSKVEKKYADKNVDKEEIEIKIEDKQLKNDVKIEKIDSAIDAYKQQYSNMVGEMTDEAKNIQNQIQQGITVDAPISNNFQVSDNSSTVMTPIVENEMDEDEMLEQIINEALSKSVEAMIVDNDSPTKHEESKVEKNNNQKVESKTMPVEQFNHFMDEFRDVVLDATGKFKECYSSTMIQNQQLKQEIIDTNNKVETLNEQIESKDKEIEYLMKQLSIYKETVESLKNNKVEQTQTNEVAPQSIEVANQNVENTINQSQTNFLNDLPGFGRSEISEPVVEQPIVEQPIVEQAQIDPWNGLTGFGREDETISMKK